MVKALGDKRGGWNQARFADAIGIHQSELHYILRGREIKFWVGLRIIRILNWEPKALDDTYEQWDREYGGESVMGAATG